MTCSVARMCCHAHGHDQTPPLSFPVLHIFGTHVRRKHLFLNSDSSLFLSWELSEVGHEPVACLSNLPLKTFAPSNFWTMLENYPFSISASTAGEAIFSVWCPSNNHIRVFICWSCIRRYVQTAESYSESIIFVFTHLLTHQSAHHCFTILQQFEQLQRSNKIHQLCNPRTVPF